MLCKWYNVGEQDSSIGNPSPHDGDMYFAGSSDDGADLLELGSDDSDNAEPNAILFESASEHSETEILLGSDQEMLMESGEDVVGRSVEEPPAKKRKYATRNKTTLNFLGKEVLQSGAPKAVWHWFPGTYRNCEGVNEHTQCMRIGPLSQASTA